MREEGAGKGGSCSDIPCCYSLRECTACSTGPSRPPARSHSLSRSNLHEATYCTPSRSSDTWL